MKAATAWVATGCFEMYGPEDEAPEVDDLEYGECDQPFDEACDEAGLGADAEK